MEETTPMWADILDTVYFGGLDGRLVAEIVEHEEFERTDTPTDLPIDRLPSDSEIWDLDRSAQKRIFEEMETAGLIELREVEDKEHMYNMKLTAKGFDVAHSRQLRKEQQQREQIRHNGQYKTNRMLAFLTISLVFVSGMQVIVPIFNKLNADFLEYTMLGFVLLFVLGTTVYKIRDEGLWEDGKYEL